MYTPNVSINNYISYTQLITHHIFCFPSLFSRARAMSNIELSDWNLWCFLFLICCFYPGTIWIREMMDVERFSCQECSLEFVWFWWRVIDLHAFHCCFMNVDENWWVLISCPLVLMDVGGLGLYLFNLYYFCLMDSGAFVVSVFLISFCFCIAHLFLYCAPKPSGVHCCALE